MVYLVPVYVLEPTSPHNAIQLRRLVNFMHTKTLYFSDLIWSDKFVLAEQLTLCVSKQKHM